MTPGLAAGLAAGLLAGVPLAVLALLAVAWSAPLPASALVAGGAAVAVRRRRRMPRSEAARLVAIASELRSGASLRASIGTLSARLARLALAGRPVGELVPEIESALPRNGALVGTVVALADRLGGSVASMFEELAVQALEADELARELGVAAAPALLQGVIVGGVPVIALVRLVISGRLVELASSGPAGAALVLVGVGLVLVGVGTVAALVRRSAR